MTEKNPNHSINTGMIGNLTQSEGFVDHSIQIITDLLLAIEIYF